MNVGLVTRYSRSSRKRAEAGSTCSLDEGLLNFPSDIFDILDLNLPFFFSNVLLALLKLFSVLKVLSSTTLVRDLFIKSSANDTFGLVSRFAEFREVIDDRRLLELCREKLMSWWFE